MPARRLPAARSVEPASELFLRVDCGMIVLWGGCMARERKSARELAKMIAERMKIEPSLVSIHRDPVYGWAVKVFIGPALFGDQPLAERIAAELRERYDLTV